MLKQGKEAKNDPKSFLAHGEKIRAAFYKVANKAGFINQQSSLDLISTISNLLPKLQNDPQAIISPENQKVADLYDLTKISYVDFLELINLVIFKEEDLSHKESPPNSQRIPPIDGNDSARRKLPERNMNLKNKKKEEASPEKHEKQSPSPTKRASSITNSRNSPLPSQKNSNQPSPKHIDPIINPSDGTLSPKNEIDEIENTKEIDISVSEKKSVEGENKGKNPQLYIPIGTTAGVAMEGSGGTPVNNSVNHGKSYQGSGGGSQRSVCGNDFPEGYEKNWENLSNLLSEHRNVFLERFGKYKSKGTEKISLEKYPEYLKICVEEVGLMILKESVFEKKSIFASSDPFKILEGVVGAYLYGRKKRSAKVSEKIELTFLECFKVLKYWFKVDADIILIDDYYEERKKRLAVRDHIIAMIHKYEKMKQESKEIVEKKAFQTTLDALYKRFFEDYPGHSITQKPDDLDAVDQEAGGTETKEKGLFKKLEEKLTEQSETKTVPTEQSQQKTKEPKETKDPKDTKDSKDLKAKPSVVKENSKQKLSPQKVPAASKETTKSESPQKPTAATVSVSKESNKSESPRKTSLPKETNKSESPQKNSTAKEAKTETPRKNDSPLKTNLPKEKSPQSPKKEPVKQQPEPEEMSKEAMALLEHTLGAVLKHDIEHKGQKEQEEEEVINKDTTMTPSENNPSEAIKKSKEEEDPRSLQVPEIRGSFEVSATPLQGSPKVTIPQPSSGFNSQKETIISNKEKDTIVLKETPMTKKENSSPRPHETVQSQREKQKQKENPQVVEKIHEAELKIEVPDKKEENLITSPRRESPKQLTFGGNGGEDKIIMNSPKELPKELSQLSFSPNQAQLIETIQVSQMNLPSPREKVDTQDERSMTPERIREELKFSKSKNNDQRHSLATDTLTTTIEKSGILSEARRVRILKQIFDHYSKKIAGTNKVGYKSFEEIEKEKEGITLDIMSILLKDFKIKVDAAKLRDKFKKEKKQDITKLTFEEFDSFMKKLIIDAEIAVEQKPKQQADAAALRQRYRPSSYKSDPPVIKRSESPPIQKGTSDLSENEETRKIKDDEFWVYISEKYKEVLGLVKGDREQTPSYESEKKSNSIRRSVDAERIKHLYASIPDNKREVPMIKEAREDTRLSTQQEKSIKGYDINESLVKERSSKKSLNRSVSMTGGDSSPDLGSTDEVRRSHSNKKKVRESQEKPRKREVSSKGRSKELNETARIMDASIEKGRFPKEMLNESINKRQNESLDSNDDIPLRKSIEKSPVIRAKVQRSPEKVVQRSKPEPRRLHETFNPEDLFDKNDSEDDIYLAQYGEIKKARKANSDNTHNHRNFDEKSRLLGALKLPRDMRKYRHIHDYKMVRKGTEKNLHNEDGTHATSERNNTPPSQRGGNISGSKEITFGRATGIQQKTINEIKLLNNRGAPGQSLSQSPSPPNRSSLDISMSNHSTQKGQMYHIPQVYNHMPPYSSHNAHQDLLYSPGKQAKPSPRGFHSAIEHAGAGAGGSNRASIGGGNYSNITPPPYMNNLYPSWYQPVMHHPSMNHSGIYQGVNASMGSGMTSGIYPGGNLQQGGVGGLNRNPNIQQGQQGIRAYPPGQNMQNPHHNMHNFPPQQQSMDMGSNLAGKNAQLRRISQHGGNPEMYQGQQPYYPLVMQQSNGQPLLMPMEQRRMSNKRSISNNARGRVSEVEEYLNQREAGAMSYMLNIEKLMRMKGQRAAWK